MVQSKNKVNKSDENSHHRPHFLLSLASLDPRHLKPPGSIVTHSPLGHVGTYHMHENTGSAKPNAQIH